MGHILPKHQNATTNFFEYSIVSDKLPEDQEKFRKILGANQLILAGQINSYLLWTQKLNWTLRPSFYS